MSNSSCTQKKIYLDVNSGFRDRNAWPNESEFDLVVSQSGRNTSLNSIDPVCESSTKHIWTSNMFKATTSSADIDVIVDQATTLGLSGDQLTVIVHTSTKGELQPIKNYYAGAEAILGSAGDLNRIISYEYLGNDNARITFAKKFDAALLVNTNTIKIHDPTFISTPYLHPCIFVPNGDENKNAYINDFLFNETLNECRRITGYDNVTHTLTIDTLDTVYISTKTSGPVSTPWTESNVYSIRKKIPIFVEKDGATKITLQGDVTNCPITTTSFNLLSTSTHTSEKLQGSFLERKYKTVTGAAVATGNASTIEIAVAAGNDDYYIGCTIRVLVGTVSETRTITDYTDISKLVTVSPPFSAAITGTPTYVITCPNESRRIVKYVNYTDTFVGTPTTTTAELSSTTSSTASDIDGFYNNLYIVHATSGTRLIKKYEVLKNADGTIASKTITLERAWTTPAFGDSFTIRSGIVSPGFSGSIATDDVFILPFSYDNFTPLFNSKKLSLNQYNVCYQISMDYIILPNMVIKTGNGGTISNYPYIYVELHNTDGSTNRNGNEIYSNNPFSQRMSFKVPITDICPTYISSFVKLDRSIMTHITQFNPGSNIHFSVRLPDGSLFVTDETENFSPHLPNRHKQISANFTMTQVNTSELNACDIMKRAHKASEAWKRYDTPKS